MYRILGEEQKSIVVNRSTREGKGRGLARDPVNQTRNITTTKLELHHRFIKGANQN